MQLRESILHTLQQTSSDLLAQHTATAYGYRHRLHEYNMALDELYYQKKLVSVLAVVTAVSRLSVTSVCYVDERSFYCFTLALSR